MDDLRPWPATRTAKHGTYALIMRAAESAEVVVGRLGALSVRPGYYIYVGSALGPGGLAARIRHHLVASPYPHWHIDYLRQAVRVEAIWCVVAEARLEHVWARALGAMEGVSLPVRGFGASDCACPSHLFFLTSTPPLHSFRRVVAAHSPGMALNARVME